jgi:outer membrane receptor for ferric coprogen and ferric-rhodotorulic acid
MPGRPLAGGGFDNSPIRQSGYMLAHVMARYDVNKNLSVTARVNNLFDKEYYREFGFYNGLIYGEPRNFMVNVQARF